MRPVKPWLLGLALAGAAMPAPSHASVSPPGTLPAGCSGVPGDLRTPTQSTAAGVPTHGPGAVGRPVALTAVARPDASSIPPLYVFDDHGRHVMAGDKRFKVLDDPAFDRADHAAYWGELVDDAFYRIPWLDKCAQASMLAEPVSFRAPQDGVLFMQFLTPACAECAALTAAIEGVIAGHPTLPVRWVRISVPFEFEPKD